MNSVKLCLILAFLHVLVSFHCSENGKNMSVNNGKELKLSKSDFVLDEIYEPINALLCGSPYKIWGYNDSNYSYNAFTDLIRFNNNWYCVFREASTHAGTIGRIRIIKSSNAINWSSITTIDLPNNDLRDPKLSIDSDDSLVVNMFSGSSTVTYISKSDDGDNWTNLRSTNSGVYWSIEWNSGIGYSIKYPMSPSVCLYQTNNAIDFVSVCNLTSGTESSIYFNSLATMHVIIRGCNNSNAKYGYSLPPSYSSWNFWDIGCYVAGPDIIVFPYDGCFLDGTIWIAGRNSTTTGNTVLWQIENGTAVQKLALPRQTDSGYPGLVWYNDYLWISYSAFDDDNKTSVYIAKVRFTNQDIY